MAFRLSIITDEIGEDFERALDLVHRWGLPLVELRTVWGKGVVDLSPEDVARVRLALESRGLAVECIASPLFKSALPRSGSRRESDGAGPEPERWREVLAAALGVARTLGARTVRAFSFWRGVGQQGEWAEIAQFLRDAAGMAEAEGCVLALENEHTCAAGTGVEAAALLEAVGDADCGVIWDPANAHVAGEAAYPDGYRALRGRIVNVHVKDCMRTPPAGGEPWRLLGEGEVDWPGQLAALAADGYDGPLTLEPHPVPPYGREEAASLCLAALRRMLSEVR